MTAPTDQREAIARAISDADRNFGYHIRLTSLVEGVSEYTVTIAEEDGSWKFDSHQEAAEWVDEQRQGRRADAILSLRPSAEASERAREGDREQIREAFLNMIADADRFDEDVDGDADEYGRPVVTINYHLTVGHHQLQELCDALGIEAKGYDETLFDAIHTAVAEPLQEPLPHLAPATDAMRMRESGLVEALRKIDGEASAKEPPASRTVGFDHIMEDPGFANDIADEAFSEGVVRGLWEAARIARSALGEEKTKACCNHPDRPVRDVLDGDALCQECCNAWARAEGDAAALASAQPPAQGDGDNG